jgi:hypothetical protein
LKTELLLLVYYKKGVLETINFFFGSNRNKLKLNLFLLSFGLFRKNIFFSFFGLFRTVIKTTKTNRTLSKQTEKISKKLSLLGGPRNCSFFSRFELKETETQSVLVLYQVFFSRNKKKYFGLFWCFGPVSKQLKQTELMVWGIKKVYILTNFLLFRLVFCLFRLFRNMKLPVSLLKRNNRNNRLVSDSAETSFGSSFGSFEYETSFGGHPFNKKYPFLPLEIDNFVH